MSMIDNKYHTFMGLGILDRIEIFPFIVFSIVALVNEFISVIDDFVFMSFSFSESSSSEELSSSFFELVLPFLVVSVLVVSVVGGETGCVMVIGFRSERMNAPDARMKLSTASPETAFPSN